MSSPTANAGVSAASGVRPTTAGAVAAVTSLLVLVVWMPGGHAAFWSAKTAVLLGPGLLGIVTLARNLVPLRERVLLAAATFVAAAALATGLSDQPVLSLLGHYNRGTGLLFDATLVGLWMLGRALTDSDDRGLQRAIVVGLLATCLLGALQPLADLPALDVAGRAAGFSGNPNDLGALAVVLTAFGAWQVRTRLFWLLLVFVGSTAAQASGSRTALGLLVVLALGSRAWTGSRRVLAIVVVIVVGVVVGALATELTGGSAGVRRSAEVSIVAGEGSGGLGIRRELWASAAGAVADRPFLGHGPGMFRTATSPATTSALARAEGPDVLHHDAHNLVVEHFVATGLVGGALFVSWLLLACRDTQLGPFLLGAAVLLASGLLNPMSVATTPLAFLLLGAASRRSQVRQRRGLPTIACGVLLTIGVAGGLMLVVADRTMQQGLERADVGRIEAADRVLGGWPEPALLLAVLYGLETEEGGVGRPHESLRWWRHALARDRSSPALWVGYGRSLERTGRSGAAEAAYRRALTLNPWSGSALEQLLAAARRRGDAAAERRWSRRLAVLEPSAARN